MKGVFIQTYGCQMNASDSDRMRAVLAPYFEARPSSAVGARDRAVARLLYEPLFCALDRIEGVADVRRV